MLQALTPQPHLPFTRAEGGEQIWCRRERARGKGPSINGRITDMGPRRRYGTCRTLLVQLRLTRNDVECKSVPRTERRCLAKIGRWRDASSSSVFRVAQNKSRLPSAEHWQLVLATGFHLHLGSHITMASSLLSDSTCRRRSARSEYVYSLIAGSFEALTSRSSRT